MLFLLLFLPSPSVLPVSSLLQLAYLALDELEHSPPLLSADALDILWAVTISIRPLSICSSLNAAAKRVGLSSASASVGCLLTATACAYSATATSACPLSIARCRGVFPARSCRFSRGFLKLPGDSDARMRRTNGVAPVVAARCLRGSQREGLSEGQERTLGCKLARRTAVAGSPCLER